YDVVAGRTAGADIIDFIVAIRTALLPKRPVPVDEDVTILRIGLVDAIDIPQKAPPRLQVVRTQEMAELADVSFQMGARGDVVKRDLQARNIVGAGSQLQRRRNAERQPDSGGVVRDAGLIRNADILVVIVEIASAKRYEGRRRGRDLNIGGVTALRLVPTDLRIET